MVTIFANPSLRPGIGTSKLRGINRSTKDSTSAKEINMLFNVSFFNLTTTNDSFKIQASGNIGNIIG